MHSEGHTGAEDNEERQASLPFFFQEFNLEPSSSCRDRTKATLLSLLLFYYEVLNARDNSDKQVSYTEAK